MSRKQDQYDAMLRQFNDYLNKATAESPYETVLGAQQQKWHDWLMKGDLKNTDFVDRVPLAENAQQAHYMPVQNDTTAAGAYVPPETQKLLNADETNRAWGDLYGQNAGMIRQRSNAALGDLANRYNERMQLGVQGASQQLQNLANRPRGFNFLQLLGPATSVASAFI